MRIEGMFLVGILGLSFMGILGQVGCDRPAVTQTTAEDRSKDNTGINERDQSGVAKTPLDQGENAADVALTANIRKQVVAQPKGATEMLSPGTFGHGGAFGTQGWIDPKQGAYFILMIQRTGIPNGDASEFRKEFQRLTVEMLKK